MSKSGTTSKRKNQMALFKVEDDVEPDNNVPA